MLGSESIARAEIREVSSGKRAEIAGLHPHQNSLQINGADKEIYEALQVKEKYIKKERQLK